MRKAILFTTVGLLTLGAAACGPEASPDKNLGGTFTEIAQGSPQETAVLALVNDPQVDFELLDDDVGLDKRAATNIIVHRNGLDQQVGTSDDNPFDTVGELDKVKFVGASALGKLLAYAEANGYLPGDSGEAPTAAERDYAMLALANDATVDIATLDDDVGLDKRAANNIATWRNGVDAVAGTADDRSFMNVEQLDAIKYVGNTALGRMRDYAVSHGYLDTLPSWQADVVFSPQPYSQSHAVRVAKLIDQAQSSIDIAMYSSSDAGINDALEAAVKRGVKIRFIFESGNSDRLKSGSAFDNSRSARLEKMGINVRYVNKIMHHKFAIVDGPRDDLATASSATLISGSGNWSHGAATRYDENTLFLTGQTKLNLLMQREFNHLWEHSRDFVFDANLPYELSGLSISDEDIEGAGDGDALFTSDNFNVSGDTFKIVSGRDTIADGLVEAIEDATDSILIASGHLRSRPVAEALMAKRQANPNIDIRVYLDGQEYISAWYNNEQIKKRTNCLADAGDSVSKIRKCNDKGFYFGYELGQAGVDVAYKYYAFRWDYSYALQMHHKLMIIDGDELWTGSYNLSDNAEHNTFENMMVLRGLPFATLIKAYVDNFETLWNTARDDGTYEALLNEVNTASVIPLVFDPMALDHAQVTALKNAIKSNCPAVWSAPYKAEPAKHQYCPRSN